MTSRRCAGAWPWLVLVLALVLALTPVWRLAAVGFEPTLEQLLELRCFGDRGQRPTASGRME
jgi:hypothetical protein